MSIDAIKTALLTVGVPVSHYNAVKQPNKYIVWAEEGEGDSVHADDRKEIQALHGTIDYFTKTEKDPIVEQIQEGLDNADIAWTLNSVQHERDTGYIHYEWLWEVDGIG
jgi:hypothetical protein